MTTVLDILQKGTDFLARKEVEEARLTMQHMLAERLNCERMQLYVDFDRPLDEADVKILREWVKRRGSGEPLQHILGSVEFADYRFAVDARALIPRPETEELVEMLVERSETPPRRVLDVGCGSGVIGLSLAKRFGSETSVLLVDAAEEALALAEENRAALEVENAELTVSDLFSGIDAGAGFDLIVANLPYIATAEIAELDREVQHDPHAALDGGETGLEIMQRFLADCPGYLSNQAAVAMEFGEGQAEPLRQAAAAAGLENIEIVKDLSGHERFLFAGFSRNSA
jgi:release factor glutamine methyltransferase